MVQKRSGRPRNFDPEAAALAAVEVFWQNGYDGASLEDLTAALGINRPSLYNAFGDKRGLFLAALDAYGRNFGRKALEAFEAESDLRAAITAFFRTALANATRPGAARGCLVGSAAVASLTTTDGVDETVRRTNQELRRKLAERFEAEARAGRLSQTPSPESRAALTVELMQGQAFRARIGDADAEIARDLDMRVASVLAAE